MRADELSARDHPSEPVEVPPAEPIVGGFRLIRRSESLNGGSVLVFESDGSYHGRFEGPGGEDTTKGRLDEDGQARLRELASSLRALPDDEYSDPEIRDGLRVTYRVEGDGHIDSEIRCLNRFPPAAEGVEQLVREHVSRNW